MFYPIKKQMVVAFGEGSNNRLGDGTCTSTLPKACYSTKELKPHKIVSSYWQTVMIDGEGRLFRTGQFKKSGAAANIEY